MSNHQVTTGNGDFEVFFETGAVQGSNLHSTTTGSGGGGHLGYDGGTIAPIKIETTKQLDFFLKKDSGGVAEVNIKNPSVGLEVAHRVTVFYGRSTSTSGNGLVGIVNHATGRWQILTPQLKLMMPKSPLAVLIYVFICIASFVIGIVFSIEYLKLPEFVAILLGIFVGIVGSAIATVFFTSLISLREKAFLKRTTSIVRGAIDAAVEREKGRGAG